LEKKMEKKTCQRCGQEKTLDEFHYRARSKDGRQAYCKDCNTAQAAEWGVDNIEKRRLYQRRTYQRYKIKFAVKDKAHKAFARGEIEWKPCELCGCKESEMHHEDYNKPYDVTWLCHQCHMALHAAKREAARKVRR